MANLLLTALTATIGISIVFGIWLIVDQMSRKRFGERPHGCGGHGKPGGSAGGEGCGRCSMKDDCDDIDEL